jgi:hypothetical protein
MVHVSTPGLRMSEYNGKKLIKADFLRYRCGPTILLLAATKDQLLSLPGVTVSETDRVIVGRPYSEPGEVATRRIVP